MLPELSDRDRAILEFEERTPASSGPKEGQIRDLFGLSATRYYQLLNRLIDDPAAVAAYPALVKSLHRRRVARTTARAARRV